MMITQERGLFRWLFEDRGTGRIVIGQMPNAALWIVLGAFALGSILPDSRAATATRIVLLLALAYWAVDERARGVNPWRRILGTGTLVAMTVWLVVSR